MSNKTMEAAVVAAAALTTELTRSIAAGRDLGDVLEDAAERVGFLGDVAPDWRDPGPPPASSVVPDVDAASRETLVALQACLTDLRARAGGGVEGGEGWGNSEWALDRLALLTGVPWREADNSPAGIVRAAIAAISRDGLTEQDFLREFSDKGAPFGHNRLFDAMHAIRDHDAEPLALLTPLLKAMRTHAKQVKAGKLPETWLIHVLLDNLKYDVKALGG